LAREPKKYADLVVTGASGRVGRLLCEQALADEAHWELVAAVAHRGSASIGVPCSEKFDHAPAFTPGFGGACDLVIDFSTPAGTALALETALRGSAALLVATTGLSEDIRQALNAAGQRIAVLVAPNTSIGVAVCADAVKRAASVLGAGYRVEIVEAHHKHKKDAPSGTALMLGEAAKAGGCAVERNQIHAMRGGDIVGEHVVRFIGEGEYLEFSHTATSRVLFARGALRMGRWLLHQGPGLYGVGDFLAG
jgi:4-hydroxy-tetrahydrodipicolinate reductase